MKKIAKTLSILLALIICISCITSCNSESSGNSGDREKEITLTKENFDDYFSIQFDPQNARLKKPDSLFSRSLCDLAVKIASLTDKKLSNVTIELKITIKKGSYHKPSGENNEFERTISIPASGSTSFSITIETWTTFSDVKSPEIGDLKYEIVSVKGTLS